MGKYALILVSALIFSVITYSHALRNALFISNTRTVQSYSQNQAHNIAQSTLIASIKDINDGGGNIEIPNSGETWESGFLQWNNLHGEFNVQVFHDDVNDILRVQSTGRFEDVIYIATAGLVLSGGTGGFPWPNFDSAIHTEENMSIGNGNVYGDVFSGGNFSIPGNAQVHGNVYVYPDEAGAVTISSGGIIGNLYANTTKANGVQYTNWGASISGDLLVGPNADPAIVAPKISQWHSGHVGGTSGAMSNPIPKIELEVPEFPEVPHNQPLLPPVHLSGVQAETIDLTNANAFISSIDVHNDTHLTVIVGSQDRILRVNDFNMTQGHLNIISEGDGRLQLVVENHFNIGGSSSMNNNTNPGGNEQSPLNLLIAYGGSGKFTVGGNQPINGNIFIKDADLHLGESGLINGNIITGGESVTIDGDGGNNSRLIYAPNAHVNMSGSGKVNGSIVAKTFGGTGGFSVTYTTDFEDTLPDLDFEGGSVNSGYSIAFWH